MKLYVVQHYEPYEGRTAAEAVYFADEFEKMLQDYPGIMDDTVCDQSSMVYVIVERS